MTRSDLPLNQLQPAARPVDAFIQPGRRDVAAPAQPQLLPAPGGLRLISQASAGNVAGFNQWEQLAEALAPFRRNVMDLADAGAKFYASREYEQGRSEVLRAQVLANQQMQASAAEYAAEGRKLAQSDPIAAVMMDRVNPFREGGRQNALTRLAGQEIPGAVLTAFRTAPGAEALMPGSTEIKVLEAKAVQGVLDRYGVREGMPGYVENVLPAIGQASQRLTEQHYDAYTRHQKDTAWRNAAEEAALVYQQAVTMGTVEWVEYDPGTGTQVRKVASRASDPAAWQRGIQMRIGQVADGLRTNTGLQGETTELQTKMFRRLAAMAQTGGMFELGALIKGVSVGPPEKRSPAAFLFGEEMEESSFEAEKRIYAQSEQRFKTLQDKFEAELADATIGIPNGPEREAKINSILDKYRQTGLSLNRMLTSVESVSATIDKVGARSYDPGGMDEFLQEIQARVGSSWNAATADKQFERLLATIPPDMEGEYRRRYAGLRQGKEKERDDVPGHLVNPIVDGAIKANLRKHYPKTITEASLRGADVTTFMASGDANVAESARRQMSAYRTHVYTRLQEAAAKKKAMLTPAEITKVTADAVREYGSKDKEAMEYLFPGSSLTDTPSVLSGRAQPPASGSRPVALPPGRQAAGLPVYPTGQLDNMPSRAQRLKAGPVMDYDSAVEEVARMANGERPSPAVIRAARDAGLSPGRFLLRQLDAYPAFKLPPDARQKLLQTSRGAAAAGNAAANWGTSQGPLQAAAFSLFDALTGARPAAAGTLGGARMSGVGQGGRGGQVAMARGRTPEKLLALLRSGEGGWSSVNRGKAGDSPGGIGDLTRKTIGSIERMQGSKRVFAVGAYQFTPGVLALARREAGLSPDAPFSPENQNRMAMALMLGSKRPRLRAYLRGESNNLDAAHQDLSLEWASVAGPNGRGAYDGDSAGNFAGIRPGPVRQALIEARRIISGR